VAHSSRASMGDAKSASRRGIVLQPVGIALTPTMSPRRRTRTPPTMSMVVTATGTPTPAQQITLPMNLASSSYMTSTTGLIRFVLQVGQV
jgi:hypothetical protein